MTGPYSECQIRIHRDALNTPWGLRLQGGKDFKTPLTVQRVFVGSPADGELHRGDVIVAIDNYDTNHLTHKQAQDVIKNAGGSLSLRIKRGAGSSTAASKPIVFSPSVPGLPASSSSYRSRPADIGPFSPKTSNPQNMQSMGVDYSRGGQYNRPGTSENMMHRVKNTLNNQLWTPDDSQDPEYEKKPLRQIKQMFSQDGPSPSQADSYEPMFQQQQQQQQPQHQNQSTYQTPGHFDQQPAALHASGGPSYKPRAQPWRKPAQSDGSALKEPGWAAKSKGGGWHPLAPSQNEYHEIVNRPQQAPVNDVYQSEQHRHRDMGRPAWSGSLRPGGGPKPWEVHASETIAPGSTEFNVQRGPSDVPRQAPQSQSYQPQQHNQGDDSPNIHGQVHNPRVQNVHYGPGQSPQYQQKSPAAASDTASVVHNQYNSPLGLYSKDNVSAALHGQTTGKPGQGTMQVTGGDGKKEFNPAQSDVYRLLQEEEETNKRRAEQSARYAEHGPGQEMQYHGYMDHTHQSPKMNALEAHVMDEGTSDF